ncbi:hypothetical protein P153DRAFT_366225 [Dothidotthia symphoricarpi CBS 119687]|uniref:F-box domain-containing protein n=1 Tax=Dothidotthia symphoricarpi CBS 119687 TaxID=1392245 RepID=A0A6A6AD22_9PLEO|nr:uncharacterized protein P153DRAFT_366225 [Dothidotthia symphoricarpi CBS 119687]KAF2129719.1 hypothetical protein P153DRAFT_366225 [Dothidotthia symphoricarpi CBS 119687]
MLSLVDLPSEVLSTIIELVLAPSTFPQDAKRCRPAWNAGHRQVICVPDLGGTRPTNSIDLLLTNRRLHAETVHYLSKTDIPQVFKLDIAIIDGHWIWPTWRYVPTHMFSRQVDLLEFNIIPCCTEDERVLQSDWEPDALIFKAIAEVMMITAFQVVAFGIAGTNLCSLKSENHDPDSTFQESCSRQIRMMASRVDMLKQYKTGNQPISYQDIPIREIADLAHLTFDPLYPMDSIQNLQTLDQNLVEAVNQIESRGNSKWKTVLEHIHDFLLYKPEPLILLDNE